MLGPTAFDPVAVFDLGLELGVMARRDVDLVDLRRVPVVFQKEILTAGRQLSCVDPRRCEAFCADAIALYVACRDELAFASREEGSR